MGISTDDVETQRKFKERYALPYPLLSDAGGKVASQYGGLVPIVGVAHRVSFVLGGDGRIVEIVSGSDAIDPTRAVAACGNRPPGGRP